MRRARVRGWWWACALTGVLGCRGAELELGARAEASESAERGHDEAPTGLEPRGHVDALDPCAEVGVVVPRLSVELRAPRTGTLRGGDLRLHGGGELVFEVEAADDHEQLEVQQAELAVAKASRERYVAEQDARARDLRRAEGLGEYLAGGERDAARDAHSISTRELHRADAARRAASARLEAQRARIEMGRLLAPFAGRIVEPIAIVGAWVEAGQLLARFASTDDLVLRVGLPAERSPSSPTEVRWGWPGGADDPSTAVLHPVRDEVDELSGLRLYEAHVNPEELGSHALGATVWVELPHCHEPTTTRDPDDEHS